MSLDNHADVPREYGKSLCACVPCRLVKTFDQVSMHTPPRAHQSPPYVTC